MSRVWRAAVEPLLPAVDTLLPEASWWPWLTTLLIWSSRMLVPFLRVRVIPYLGWVLSASARFAPVPRLHRRLADTAATP